MEWSTAVVLVVLILCVTCTIDSCINSGKPPATRCYICQQKLETAEELEKIKRAEEEAYKALRG